MGNFIIEYYESKNGSFPAEGFILAQDHKMQAKIFMVLHLLEIEGHRLREPYSKHLKDGIFELQARLGTRTARVLYFFVVGRKIILTNGFIKKMRRTPPRIIALAKKYRSDYRRQKGDRHG